MRQVQWNGMTEELISILIQRLKIEIHYSIPRNLRENREFSIENSREIVSRCVVR